MKKYFKGAPKIGTTTYNMKACLSFFYFDIFKHRQISLNFLMNDRHFNNISQIDVLFHDDFVMMI
jgi:hypothetical protein